MTLPSYRQQRANMVECQIMPFSVVDTRVLEAFRTIPREDFLPEERRGIAYLGDHLPMGAGEDGADRFLIAPAIYARLLQQAGIHSESRVLDIGCLTGYSTAVLNSLSSHVWGLDTQDWVQKARQIAESSGLAVPDFFIGALAEGVPDQAPFDVIVMNGAVEIIPPALAEQLAEDGVIATFWRGARNQGHAVLYRKRNGHLHQEILFDAFVPLLAGFEQEKGFSL